MEQLGSHWTNFHEVLYLIVFRKSVKKIQVLSKSDNNGHSTFMIYLAYFFLKWKMFQTKVVEKTYILMYKNFFFENGAVCETM
jgi:hypothetical protein